MEAIIERCCGLDVHQRSVVACILSGPAESKPTKEVRKFGTMRHELGELREWISQQGCTHVAMESTGVYWMPVYKELEGSVELVVGNAQHLSKVPGRKTDVLDSEWLAELLRHGLIKKSFIPPPPIRELRELTRYRRKLVQSRSGERNRLQKMLETANIKLASVMSDVFGVSGMAMLRALVAGEQSREQIARLARGPLRNKRELLELALDGRMEEHHRYLLQVQLERLEQLEAAIGQLDERIETKLEPYRDQYERLKQIPGVSRVVASVIIAELGVDMNVFPSKQDCASWAGVCPGNNESAGKRKSARSRRGNKHLKTALVEAAQGAVRSKGTYLRSKFHQLRARTDYKTAAVAVAHKILTAAYYMLATGEDYRELGETYLEQKNPQQVADRLVRRLEKLGYSVELKHGDYEEAKESKCPAQVVPRPAERAQQASEVNGAKVEGEPAQTRKETSTEAAVANGIEPNGQQGVEVVGEQHEEQMSSPSCPVASEPRANEYVCVPPRRDDVDCPSVFLVTSNSQAPVPSEPEQAGESAPDN